MKNTTNEQDKEPARKCFKGFLRGKWHKCLDSSITVKTERYRNRDIVAIFIDGCLFRDDIFEMLDVICNHRSYKISDGDLADMLETVVKELNGN